MTRPVLLFPLLLVFSQACAPSPVTSGLDARHTSYPAAVDSADLLVRRLFDSLALPGLGVAVASEGRIVWTGELGMEDLEAGRPIVPGSLFRIGSVSKLLTTAAAVRLAHQGRLDLDAPIGRYLPTLPPDKRNITARQLAGHLGGIRHYTRNEFFRNEPYDNVTGGLGIFIEDTLIAPPGTQQSYSSFGYNLLGAVIQAAAGTDFREVVRSEVTEPLGMTRTTVEASLPTHVHTATFYVRLRDSLRAAPRVDLSDRWPSGGFISTATDLALFGIGILRDEWLDGAARAELFTPRRLADGTVTGVGLGWRITRDSVGRRIVHHGGEAAGSRAFLLVYPDHGIAVAMLANQGFAPLREEAAERIAQFFLR